MKVGLSLSRCVRDVYEGRVEENDVLVIIARTDVDPHDDEQWKGIWVGYLHGGYSNAEWEGLEEHEIGMRRVLINLYDDGKIHQPRKFGANPRRLPYHWLDCGVIKEDRSPAAQRAWEQYQIIEGLSTKQFILKDQF